MSRFTSVFFMVQGKRDLSFFLGKPCQRGERHLLEFIVLLQVISNAEDSSSYSVKTNSLLRPMVHHSYLRYNTQA